MLVASVGERLTDMDALVPLALIALTGLFGLALLFSSKKLFGRAYRLGSAPGIDRVRAHDGPTFVTLAGTVRIAESAVEAPYSETECVAYEYDRQVREEPSEEQSGLPEEETIAEKQRRKTWKTVHSQSKSVPFDVETATGTVHVDPDGAQLELPKKAIHRPSLGRRMVRKLVGRIIDRDPAERHVERCLEPKENVFVAGDIDAMVPTETDAIGTISAESDPSMFLVSTKSKLRLVARHLAGGVLFAAPGITCLLLSAWLALLVLATDGFLG